MEMRKYEVWYMKAEWFRNGICGDKPDPMRLDKTHVLLKEIEVVKTEEETDLERVWVAMQGENWSPKGEARPLIAEKGLRHTSMSVGDVAVEIDSGKVWVVSGVGFKLLGYNEPWDTDGDTSGWNENGEGSERDNDRYASRNYRD